MLPPQVKHFNYSRNLAFSRTSSHFFPVVKLKFHFLKPYFTMALTSRYYNWSHLVPICIGRRKYVITCSGVTNLIQSKLRRSIFRKTFNRGTLLRFFSVRMEQCCQNVHGSTNDDPSIFPFRRHFTIPTLI